MKKHSAGEMLNTFMPKDTRHGCRQSAVNAAEIGVADARCVNLDKGFVRLELAQGDGFHFHRGANFAEDDGRGGGNSC